MDDVRDVPAEIKSPNVISYRSLLAKPGALQALVSASFGRLSFGMVSLSLLFAGQHATGSFTVSGIVLGAYAIANLSAPFKARMLDRRGQPFALTLLGLPYTSVLLGYALIAAIGVTAPAAFIALGAAAGLTAPPLGAAMRRQWAALTDDPDSRGKAYGLDVAVEETLLVTGPVLTGALIALSGPVLAVIGTAVAALIGTVGMATSVAARRLAAELTTPPHRSFLGPLRQRGFLTLVGAIVGLGLTLGLVEVGVAGTADRQGSPGIAGYLLAALSLGSAAGGVLWGRIRHRRPLRQRLLGLLLGFGIGSVAAAAAPNLYVLAIVLAATGLALAPALVTAYVLAEGLALPTQRTEATSWVNNAINIGAGLGAAGAGFLVEHIEPTAAFLIGGAVLVPPLLLLAASRRRLAGGEPEPN